MPAPKGNKNALGNKGGRPLKFKTPKDLEKACNDYFDWVDDNPWYKNEAIKSGDMAGTIIKVPTQRPYTLIAMCHHIGISAECWYDYEKRVKYSEISTRVREKIRNQKYEGAVVGAFNASIIARDLGLTDKKDITTGGEKINQPDLSKLSNKELNDYHELIKKTRG